MFSYTLVCVILHPIDSSVTCIVCSQCDSDTDYYCKDSPPAPQNCTACSGFDHLTSKCSTYYKMPYCITERRYINDSLVRITRDCSPLTLRSTCKTIQEHGQRMKVCYSTCKTSGCNSKSGPSIIRLTRTSNVYIVLGMLYAVILPKLKIGDG